MLLQSFDGAYEKSHFYRAVYSGKLNIENSNLGANKERVQLVLQQIQTQIALTSGQDKATKAINQINSIVDLNPSGPLSKSLFFLAKQQASKFINKKNVKMSLL